MLKNIDKLLTGDLLKLLCDMGHGDELVIADANFPGDSVGRRLIRLPEIDAVRAARAALSVMPLDTYTVPAAVMDLTDSDKAKGMPVPVIWDEFRKELGAAEGRAVEMEKIERFAFYERARRAYAVIQTGEARLYGNLILVKGVIV